MTGDTCTESTASAAPADAATATARDTPRCPATRGDLRETEVLDAFTVAVSERSSRGDAPGGYVRAVSGKQARASRKMRVGSDLLSRNARAMQVTAEHMLALDLSEVPLERLNQVIVGWMRAAFEQSRAIAILALAGADHAGAPNRRTFAETLVRIQWLHSLPREDRAGAVEAMIDEDRTQTRKGFRHLADMGYNSAVDLSDMESMVLEVPDRGQLREQARVFVAAAKATGGQSSGLYYAWREETQYAHATSVLAVSHAPERSGAIGAGRPPVADRDLETHRLATTLLVTYVHRLLLDEGVADDVAMSIMTTYFTAS